MGTERNGAQPTHGNAESTQSSDDFRQTVLTLGLPLVPLDKDRNIDEWQEVRAMEQIVYLASWVYIHVGVRIGRTSFADAFGTIMPKMTRAQKNAFLDIVCEMTARSAVASTPASRIGVAALGGLMITHPESEHAARFREILEGSSVAHAVSHIPGLQPNKMGYVDDDERKAIVRGFKEAYFREINKDADELAMWKRRMGVSDSEPLTVRPEDLDNIPAFDKHATAFRQGTERAVQWTLPTMPPHFFRTFLEGLDFDTLLTEPQESEDL